MGGLRILFRISDFSTHAYNNVYLQAWNWLNDLIQRDWLMNHLEGMLKFNIPVKELDDIQSMIQTSGWQGTGRINRLD